MRTLKMLATTTSTAILLVINKIIGKKHISISTMLMYASIGLVANIMMAISAWLLVELVTNRY
jgi:hypothetical protein